MAGHFVGIFQSSFLGLPLKMHIDRKRNDLCITKDKHQLVIWFLGLCLGWVNVGGRPIFHTDGWCQIVIYLTYVTSFLSSWFVASFTVERYCTQNFITLSCPVSEEGLISTLRSLTKNIWSNLSQRLGI